MEPAQFCCEMWFPEDLDKPIRLSVYFVKNGWDDYEEINRGVKFLMREGALDRAKMLAVVSGRVKQWQVKL